MGEVVQKAIMQWDPKKVYFFGTDRLPQGLKEYPWWCAWRLTLRDGKWSKPPVDPMTGDLLKGNKAVSTEGERKANYCPLNEALQALERYHANGLGIGVLGDKVAIDVDDCINPETGEIDERGIDFLKLPTYAELSPSGTGIRMIGKYRAPYDKERYYTKKGGIEVYTVTSPRYVTITGNPLNQYDVEDITDYLGPLLDKWMRRPEQKKNEHKGEGSPPPVPIPYSGGVSSEVFTDDEIIDGLRSQKGNAGSLYAGDTSLYDDDHSKADLALCTAIAFYTDSPAQVDRVFRMSGLMREKWDRPTSGSTYGWITVEKAMGLQRDKHSKLTVKNRTITDPKELEELGFYPPDDVDLFAVEKPKEVDTMDPVKGEHKEEGDCPKPRSGEDDVLTLYSEASQIDGLPGPDDGWTLKPRAFEALGEADLFMQNFSGQVLYCPALGWLSWTGCKWETDPGKPGSLLTDLVWRQYELVKHLAGEFAGKKIEVEVLGDDEQKKRRKSELKEQEEYIKSFTAHVKRCMKTGQITGIIKQCEFKMAIRQDQLDTQLHKLCTPGGVYDLDTGEVEPNKPENYNTKCTPVAPSRDPEKMEKWVKVVTEICSGDLEKVRYLQVVFGMVLFGEVFEEKMIVAQGRGGNGKSVIFNSLVNVLGLGEYAYTLNAEVLTTSYRGNIGEPYARIPGTRMVLAKGMQKGRTYNMGVVKELTSRDPIEACGKYEKSYNFKPSHSLILYTNPRPTIDDNDQGTLDRIILVPFTSRFRNTAGEKKGLENELFAECGGEILQWAIDGAVMFSQMGYKLPECPVVEQSTKEYQDENDTLQEFIDERCVVGEGYKEKPDDLFKAFVGCALPSKSYKKKHFKADLEKKGFVYKHTMSGNRVLGIELATTLEPPVDPEDPWPEAPPENGQWVDPLPLD